MRKTSLQKCMYVNDETPHRDPSTIFHSPFNKGAKSQNFNNPSYMSSEVFYPHQSTNFNQVNFARTPKRGSVSGNDKLEFSNSKSPNRVQGLQSQNNLNKSQTKYSYINDYQKFLDKQDQQQSDNKSQLSYGSNSYNKNNQNGNTNNINNNQSNKSYHFGNKSITNGVDIGLPPAPSNSTTPKNSKTKQQLNNILNQDTTSCSSNNKNRSHSYYDISEMKKRMEFDQSKTINQNDNNNNLNSESKDNRNNDKSLNSTQKPSLLKLEMVRNNQKIIQQQQSTKNALTPNSTQERIFNIPAFRNSTPKNDIHSQNKSPNQTPSNHSRTGSKVFQFPVSSQPQPQQQQQQQVQYQYQQYLQQLTPKQQQIQNKQQQQQEQQQQQIRNSQQNIQQQQHYIKQDAGNHQNNNNNQQQQNDQYSVLSQKSSGSKGNFRLMISPNKEQFGQTTHQQHYNNLSKSPTPKSASKNLEIYNPSDLSKSQQQINHVRNLSTTPKRTIDLVSNLSTKGSNSNQNYQQSDKKSNHDDDNKSVASSAQSTISQLVCNNCINKDIILDKHLRQQQEKERLAKLEKQALEAEQSNHYNQYMYNQEQLQKSKNKFVSDVQEQLEFKNRIQREEQEKEKYQRQIEQTQFQEEQERSYKQKLDDLKNYREQYKRDIETQILAKQERQNREKQVDKQILNTYAAIKEQDYHDYMNSIASKQNQTQKIRDELLHQINEKKKLSELKSEENAKYKDQMEKQLQRDMELKERQLQQRSDELKQFKEFWNNQQQIKQKQKLNEQKENDMIKQYQEAQLEQDRSQYMNSLEQNEHIKRVTAEQLKNQIDMKKHQQQKEIEEKLQYGKYLQEQQERELQLARSNFHDCDKCHNLYPTTHLTKQKLHKSKPKFKV